MKFLKNWMVVSLLALFLTPSGASAMGIEMSVGVWNQDPKGDFSYKEMSALDSLNLRNDLKYSDKTRLLGRIKIDTPLFFPNIYLMATPMEFSGTGSKDATFQFGDVTFNGNVPFTSNLKLDHYDVGLFYGIPGLKSVTGGILNIDLGINARIIDFKANITGQDTTTGQTVTESKSLTLPVPMAYLGVQVSPIKWISAEGEVRGITYGGNYYYDIIARAKIRPFGPFFAAAGYRYEKVRIDTSDVNADISLSGPFGEAGVEF